MKRPPRGWSRSFARFRRAGFLPEELREEGMRILLAQEFNSMIPARLPKGVRVAHKTGEISTHSHDAGVVLPEGAEPYLVAIMTESDPATDGRTRAVAEISRHVYTWATAALPRRPPSMSEALPIVDGQALPEELRALLRPGETVEAQDGRRARAAALFLRGRFVGRPRRR